MDSQIERIAQQVEERRYALVPDFLDTDCLRQLRNGLEPILDAIRNPESENMGSKRFKLTFSRPRRGRR